MIITRKDIMSLYKSLKKTEKTEFIESLKYKSSSAFKSYFNNPNLQDEQITPYTETCLVEHFGNQEKVVAAFEAMGTVVEKTLEEKLNNLIVEISRNDNIEELKKVDAAVNTLQNLIQTKLLLLKK